MGVISGRISRCATTVFTGSCSTITSSMRRPLTSHEEDDAYDDKEHRRGAILFLSPSNWPEPDASAAGTRTMSLLHHFASCPTSPFTSVHFGCGAKLPTPSRSSLRNYNKIHWHEIKPNRTKDMNELLSRIKNEHGPIRAVVFDRFYAEEAFSFRIRDECPDALLVLDMQDVHSLRLGRQQLVEDMDNEFAKKFVKDVRIDRPLSMTSEQMNSVIDFDPVLHSSGKTYDTFLRETASLHRSDLVLVCSSMEMKMLKSWGLPAWKLVHAPFFCNDNDIKHNDGDESSFEDRHDFVALGGFKHAPNVDSIRILHREIWPRIRNRLPNAKVYICGAYPTPEILSLHNESNGFIVRGQVDNVDDLLRRVRVLLAPIRFGAGIKGKIVDAWRCGCPVVTTPIGAESLMIEDADWGGTIAVDSVQFANSTIKLYENKELWSRYQYHGKSLLQKLFNGRINLSIVEIGMRNGLANLTNQRRQDNIGSVLWRDTRRSTEYFSKWIELKETLNGTKSE